MTNTTWNPADETGIDFSGGNLVATGHSFSGNGVRSTNPKSLTGSDRVYFEITCNSSFSDARSLLGVGDDSSVLGVLPPAFHQVTLNEPGTNVSVSGSGTSVSLGDFNGRTFGVAVDIGNQKFWITSDGFTWNAGGTADPSTGLGAAVWATTDLNGSNLYIMATIVDTGSSMTLNTGNSTFAYTVPTRFAAWDGDQPARIGTILDPTTASADIVVTHSNKADRSTSGGAPQGVFGPTVDSLTSGKYYFEISVSAGASVSGWGFADPSSSFTDLDADGTTGVAVFQSGNLWNSGTRIITGAVSGGVNNGNVLEYAVDFDAGLVWVRTPGHDWNARSDADPATGANGASFVLTAPAVPYVSMAGPATAQFNFGDTPFVDAVPSGFTAGWSSRGNAWLSIEAPDVFAAIGFQGIPGPHGEWVSIGAPDVFAAVGSPTAVGLFVGIEIPDRFSAFGFQPRTIVFNATEAHDVMHATGLGRGVDGIFIVTEAVDIFTAAGNTPISGSFNATESPDRFSALGAGVTRVRRRRIFIVT